MYVYKMMTRNITLLRRKLCGVQMQRRTLPRVSAINIVPDFLDAYSSYVCKNPECVNTIILPPAYEQLHIMQQMFDLTTKVDIRGLEGTFMKLFLMHDDFAVEVLTKALIQYHKSHEVINSIIEYSNEIPGLVIDDLSL